ncbi:SRPBCC family protein [Pseudorhodoplanes sp.]|uniref:SRPBCC family protein n=1 Tax=Pseudorhodoplanes sp. TaxID=1934341 RepID=UPI002C622F88|nr:SRPBCC family protein [Pseudorhodoplanes sp.]HWV51398.1 SRPBCC family protein [Pseudorhodoplanes sp.]
MLKAVLSIVAVVIVAVAGVVAYAAATQPDTFHVQRAATINAPPEKLSAILTDLRRGGEWSPYEKKDPAMKKIFSGPASGSGARLEWDGNGDVGAGSLTVANVTPSKVTLNLAMTRPMTANNVVEYSFKPQGNATSMTWAMHGPMPLISKVMCLFLNLDRMIGADMERGLQDLKALAER